MKRMMGVLGQVMAETTYRRFRSFAQGLPSLCVLSCWALIVSVLLLTVSGCGRYKEEFESAKQQIEKLNSEAKRLTAEVTLLNEEKNRLSDDSKTLSDKNARMQRELDELNKAKGVLAAENKDLKRKYGTAEEEIATLKREKAHLAKEIEELKKRMAELAPPPTPPVAATPTDIGPQSGREGSSPCDQVLAFMKASEGIVRQHKGSERTKLLEQVKQQYAPSMKGAPEKAIRAAEDWVKEGAKFWDKSSDDSTFRLLRLRNIVLEACGKSATGAGF
jgi:outer membrane murein-binding lipoprotein Lpp